MMCTIVPKIVSLSSLVLLSAQNAKANRERRLHIAFCIRHNPLYRRALADHPAKMAEKPHWMVCSSCAGDSLFRLSLAVASGIER